MSIDAVHFRDHEAGSDAFVSVTVEQHVVRLIVHSQANGDVEVCLDADTIDAVVDLLSKARDQARKASHP